MAIRTQGWARQQKSSNCPTNRATIFTFLLLKLSHSDLQISALQVFLITRKISLLLASLCLKGIDKPCLVSELTWHTWSPSLKNVNV